jgi:hypothetical protein
MSAEDNYGYDHSNYNDYGDGLKHDNDNLLDPRHPRSPFNKYNWFSPYSIANPGSPHYDRSQAAIAFLVQVMFWGFIAISVGVQVITKKFPYWSTVCLFAGIPITAFTLYRMAKTCPPRERCAYWALLFLFLFGVFMMDMVFRMDGKGSGLLFIWNGMSTGKPSSP